MTNRAAIPNPTLEPLSVLVGKWSTVGVHPEVPGVTLHGTAHFEWIEGGAFLKMTAALDHPQFPSGMALFGGDDESGQIVMLYFDERQVSRKYEFRINEHEWMSWRDSPRFSQRFTVTIEDAGDTMVGKGELRRNGSNWESDLDLTYTRIR